MVIVAGGDVRRRSRQTVPRPKLVQFTLTIEEFNQVSQAAERAGMARGAYAGECDVSSGPRRPGPDQFAAA